LEEGLFIRLPFFFFLLLLSGGVVIIFVCPYCERGRHLHTMGPRNPQAILWPLSLSPPSPLNGACLVLGNMLPKYFKYFRLQPTRRISKIVIRHHNLFKRKEGK